MSEEKKLKRILTDVEQSKIYVKLLKDEKINLGKNLTVKFSQKTNDRSVQQQRQQYFTNNILSIFLVDLSGLSTDTGRHLKTLEPTAGDGAIVESIIKIKNIDYHVDMCEIDDNYRKSFEQIVKKAPNITTLLNHHNFLTFIGRSYDESSISSQTRR